MNVPNCMQKKSWEINDRSHLIQQATLLEAFLWVDKGTSPLPLAPTAQFSLVLCISPTWLSSTLCFVWNLDLGVSDKESFLQCFNIQECCNAVLFLQGHFWVKMQHVCVSQEHWLFPHLLLETASCDFHLILWISFQLSHITQHLSKGETTTLDMGQHLLSDKKHNKAMGFLPTLFYLHSCMNISIPFPPALAH